MAARIAEKSLRHVSLCVSDLAQAKAFYGDVLGLEELPRPDLGIPGAWLSVGGDLQLHLLENPERASAGADHRLSIADPHFALWINDVPSMVEELALLQPSTGGPPVALANARLASSVQYDEAWLQQLLFDHPELLPLDVVDPGAGFFIARCVASWPCRSRAAASPSDLFEVHRGRAADACRVQAVAQSPSPPRGHWPASRLRCPAREVELRWPDRPTQEPPKHRQRQSTGGLTLRLEIRRMISWGWSEERGATSRWPQPS
jgi:catechol 2,3-dioxygenase-like lactoylglutathione lyase family enzyme